MQLTELIDKLGLRVRTRGANLQREITGGYASDLLSDVIARGEAGNLWITLQVHVNIVAVASMKELAGIILVNGREPQPDTIEKAEAEDVPILMSELPTFELVGRLYALGVSGTGE